MQQRSGTSKPSGRWPRTGGALGALALLLASCGGGSEPTSVLFITVDTLRADHLGCYGYERPTSPALDALAAEGVRFEKSYSMAPFTAPSHASLFTGMHAISHGVLEWYQLLNPEAATAAMRFAEAGYRTGAFYNHPSLEPSDLLRGFDHVEKRFFEEAEPTVEGYLDWLDGSEGASMAWVHLWDVHRPYGYRSFGDFVEFGGPDRPALPFAEDTYGALLSPPIGRDEGWYNMRPEERRRASMGERERMVERYDGGVRYADDALGRLFDELRARGLYEDMLIVVTADHGETLTERHGCWYTHDPYLYEETLRVPLLLRLPGGEHAGTVVEQELARGIDVLPTMLEVAGLEGGYGIQGRSLMPAVRGEGLPDSPLYAETRTRNAKERNERVNREATPDRFLEHREVLTDGSDKLIVDRETGEEFFYDLERDPGELTNEIENPYYLQRINRLRGALTQLRGSLERSASGESMSSEDLEAFLEAIGYGGDDEEELEDEEQDEGETPNSEEAPD